MEIIFSDLLTVHMIQFKDSKEVMKEDGNHILKLLQGGKELAYKQREGSKSNVFDVPTQKKSDSAM